jgi:hypothetical protein
MNSDFRRHTPSFFFPIALITVGVIWLLVNNGTIAVENLYRLLPLWPVLLIAGGLSLLLQRVWWPLAGLVWAGLAAALVWALVASPAILPTVNTVELRHETLREPLEAAQSAVVRLDLSVNSTRIHALESGDDLIFADLYVTNRAYLDVSGNQTKNVTLRHDPMDGMNFFNFQWIGQTTRPWDIGLTTEIPLDLHVDMSTGSTNMDLTGMQLEALNIEASTGSTTLVLPAGQENFPFTINASTGSITITVPEGTGFDLSVDASTGSLSIDVPEDAGVQIEVTDGGPGGLNLPGDYKKVRGDEGDKEGVYENSAYSGAATPIDIRVDMSTGSVTVR